MFFFPVLLPSNPTEQPKKSGLRSLPEGFFKLLGSHVLCQQMVNL